MDCPIKITDILNANGELPTEWSELSVLLNKIINLLEQSPLSSNSKELSLTVKEYYPFSSDRDALIEKAKLSVISETLDSLKLLYDNFERRNGVFIHSKQLHKGKYMDFVMKTMMHQLLNNFVDTFDSLDKKAKSPYNLEAILDPDYFKKSLKIHPTKDIQNRFSLLVKLVQNKLEIFKESSKINEMQKAILTCYLENLKTLHDQAISSPSTASTSSSNKESKSFKSNKVKKFCEMMIKCQRLIKEIYGLMQISTFKDNFNEKDEIFNVISEKGCESIDDVSEFLEIKKDYWIVRNPANITRSICRATALRRLNIVIKLLRKLKTLKDDLKSSYIILGLKNIATKTLNIDTKFKRVYKAAYYLTFNDSPRSFPISRVDVPQNFIRNDPVYQEINENACNKLCIVHFHILSYYEYMESLDWNPFQHRKPWKLGKYLNHMLMLIEDALNAGFNQEETHKISLDLADRYLMTKQKIKYDRETLEYRFDRFKPLKPHKFTQCYRSLDLQRSAYYKKEQLIDQLDDLFDDIVDILDRKVTNRGQLIVHERAMAMMDRSNHLFRIIRSDLLSHDDKHLYPKLIEQAVNEYLYAVEIVVKLLDLLRPNRRVTFSFSANGPFTKKIDSIGLKVKDELLEAVNSQIKSLKIQIRDKEVDLESVKNEKTQLKYLQSISKRIQLIPINELEITDEDNIAILREIIEEYEFTIIKYGVIAIS